MHANGGILSPAGSSPQSLAVKPPAAAKSGELHPANPTPPLTPTPMEDDSPTDFPELSAVDTNTVSFSSADNRCTKFGVIPTPREFNYDLKLRSGSRGRPIEYGDGAWSIIYSATSADAPLHATWGTAPEVSDRSTRILAVKTPLRRDSDAILRAEASLLTYLSNIPRHQEYIVPFHGFVPRTNSIVMTALPLTLSDYITSQAATARANFSTKTMLQPVLGMPKWLDLAERLVKGIQWLHEKAGVVHGDVKPQNILLRPRLCDNNDDDTLPFHPIYVDFTSSYLPALTVNDNSQDHSLALSALTPPFVAPELLTLLAHKSTSLVPSEPSDIFSLAVTLATAVTGDLLLYPGTNNMQRLAMSRDGHRVLEYVRSGVHGTRLPRRGTVENVLSPAVAKQPEGRITPSEWLELINAQRVESYV